MIKHQTNAFDGYKVVENGEDLNVEYFCTRFEKAVDLDMCLDTCDRYYSCDQVAEANDACVAWERKDMSRA